MQTTTKALQIALTRRSKMPALLAFGVLFLFVLSACQVAVAEDGTINIKPQATGESGEAGVNITFDPAALNDPVSGQARPVSHPQPETAPVDPDQVYEWNGVIEWLDNAGGHFIIDRGCDRWAVIPADDELFDALRRLNGEKATVWGTVARAQARIDHRAIRATSVFSPGDIRPLIALPTIPCHEPPAPGERVVVQHSEVTLHGDLVWRGGMLWLVTPRGNVKLELPSRDVLGDLQLPAAGEDSAVSSSLGEYGVVGTWDVTRSGLEIKARKIEVWPHRTFAKDHCGDGIHHFAVGDEQLGAHGTLFIDDGQWLLRTRSGVIFIHRTASTDGALVPGDVALEAELSTAAGPRRHDVVVIGEWKAGEGELHMEADRFVRIKTVCEPPIPPREPILPGEIAALGTLVFVDGQPYLNTPSGRIILFTRRDVPGAQPEPADPSIFGEAVPGLTDGAPSTDEAHPDSFRPVRQVLVVGKWLIHREHLAIVVRYALPWPQPLPRPYPIDPVPVPWPQPVPPVFSLPALPVPVDPVDPVETDHTGAIDVTFDAPGASIAASGVSTTR